MWWPSFLHETESVAAESGAAENCCALGDVVTLMVMRSQVQLKSEQMGDEKNYLQPF